jgi:hypothetical protein
MTHAPVVPRYGAGMARTDRVTWRRGIAGSWGGRLDPRRLPSGDTGAWRRVFETEDLAGRVFDAGGPPHPVG